MGVTVVALNYSLAPEKTYPTAVLQLNDAHKYIKDNAERFRVDTDKVFLAGDSAGSQLSSQLAALITNPDYAKEMSITPAFKPKEVRGTILFCGIYKMEGLVHPAPNLPKIVGWGDDVAVWAYTGSRDFSAPPVRQMSAFYHVTKDFPATFISGGNGDPLTDGQSKPFASELESKKVEVTTRFFEADHQPSLPHEYQFNLDNQDGQDALKATIEFVQKHAQNT
jgi:acetyl esterase/lipase